MHLLVRSSASSTGIYCDSRKLMRSIHFGVLRLLPFYIPFNFLDVQVNLKTVTPLVYRVVIFFNAHLYHPNPIPTFD